VPSTFSPRCQIPPRRIAGDRDLDRQHKAALVCFGVGFSCGESFFHSRTLESFSSDFFPRHDASPFQIRRLLPFYSLPPPTRGAFIFRAVRPPSKATPSVTIHRRRMLAPPPLLGAISCLAPFSPAVPPLSLHDRAYAVGRQFPSSASFPRRRDERDIFGPSPCLTPLPFYRRFLGPGRLSCLGLKAPPPSICAAPLLTCLRPRSCVMPR